MKLDKAIDFIHKFVGTLENDLFPGLKIVKISERIDAAIFPKEIESKIGNEQSGLYLISSKANADVIYVGISNYISRRIYQHIGKGFSWSKSDSEKASFPNCNLASGRGWLADNAQEMLRRAEWEVTVVVPNPLEARGMLESALIFWGAHTGEKSVVNVAL